VEGFEEREVERVEGLVIVSYVLWAKEGTALFGWGQKQVGGAV